MPQSGISILDTHGEQLILLIAALFRCESFTSVLILYTYTYRDQLE